MPGRDKSLITRNGIPDPQAYNPQTGQWESFIGVSWGKTAGGLYVPIRVDDQGRQEVTLSGPNIIKKETILLRGVRTTNYGSPIITPPVEARGFVAKLQIYGITGTFGVDEGVRLNISHRLAGAGITRVLRSVYTKRESSNRVHTCLWFPGLESNIILGSVDQEAEGPILLVGSPVHDEYLFSVQILGSFATGQGVDCDLVVEWYR